VPWRKRSRLVQVVTVPSIALILIGLYWNSFGAETASEALVWVLLHAMAFTPFAIARHRVLLLGEASLPRYGVMQWTTRLFRFLWWLLAAFGSAGFVIIMIVMMILGGTIVNAFDIPEEGAGWSLIGKIFEALATYVVARLSLILPAVALDQKLTLSTVWDLSEGNGWRLAVVVGGLPWLLNYLQGLAFSETDMIPAILRSVVYCTLLIVEVAALSLSYKALTPQLSEVSL